MCDPAHASPGSTFTAVQPPPANATVMHLAVVIAECTAMCEAEWWLDTVWFETVEHCLARTCIGGLQAPNSQAESDAGPEDTAHLQDTAGNTPSATAAIDDSPVPVASTTTLVIAKSAWNASLHPDANSETADHDTAEAKTGLAPPAIVEASAAEPEPAEPATTTTTTKVISERERKKLARQRHHNQATTLPTASDVAGVTNRTLHQKTTSPPPTKDVEPPAPVADEDTAQVVAPKLAGHSASATTDGVGRMVKKKSMG